MSKDLVTRVLTDLVSIESVNPSLVKGGAGEENIARYVADFLRKAGVECRLDGVGNSRFNVVGFVRGSGGGRCLMLNGHLDTVGAAGMESPFVARIEQGRLYGRGAQDLKGGLTAALLAMKVLAQGARLKGDVILAAVADEEFQSAGTRALLASGIRSDAAVVVEPTGLEIATAHKGFAWAEVETFGRAAHGSRPQEGLDAIIFMGRILTEIERLEKALAARPSHPLLGCGSIHASLISGGQELSSYPANCTLSLERRLVPGEDDATFISELEKIIAGLQSRDANFRAQIRPGYWARPLETPRDTPVLHYLSESSRNVLRREPALAVQSFWTDAALLSEAGIPSVLFGPGGAGLHSAVEYVLLDEVALCAEVLAVCARSYCGE